MRYKFSTVLSSSEYETEGLCDGISVRKHIAADLEEIGTFQAQADWAKLVGPLDNYKGGLGPGHSFMAVSLPECQPERFEIVSYANEFAFLHDDVTDIANQENGNAENDEVLEAFREAAQDGKIDNLKSGKRQIQAKILSTMISIDRGRAMAAMKAWAAFIEQGAGRQNHTHFRTLDEYLPYRAMDVGHMFWHALVTFGCALTIPEEERELCKELVLPAVYAASLTNDLFSYDKEYEAAQMAGFPYVINALWVLMDQHSISLEEAKLRCRARIKKEVSKYVKIIRETKARTDVSDEIKRYVEMMQYSVSGNVVWSLQCPRYHKHARYNELQLLRAMHGVEKYPARYQLPDQIKHRRSESDCAAEQVTEAAEGPTFRKRAKTDENFYGPGESGDRSGSGTDPACNPSMSPEQEEAWDVADLVLGKKLPRLKEDVVLEPYHYVSSLPSKGVRDMAIDGMNFWLEVLLQSTAAIKSIINMLHSSSLMLDDVEDHSQLRRGKPSAHVIYGEAQTINSATYQYIQAIVQLRKLNNPDCLDIFIDEIRELFVGQSYDLFWTSKMVCPSITEYLQMVDGKTGGLFRLLTRLMVAESQHGSRADFDRLCCLLGRYFQIRDDYQNLTSHDYMAQKGFCEDLDEGKYSLPLIHVLKHTAHSTQLKDLMAQRRVTSKCTLEQKQIILGYMQEAGSLEYTLQMLRWLHVELEGEMSQLENSFGKENHELRLILELLKVS
ncbi:terpenoid synthase [Glonium stellatum]|uniref:geranylgeranyl diphosphate synthase n=1 Tax=Glonium stellatum TaxID=574774 RepID=A0A8E2F2T8_9PEZI|nr:terpenoid synthase [Glonium stellatum]